MVLTMHAVGSRHFDGPLTVTDPCYSKDVWCRIDGIKILPGEYVCKAYTGYTYYTFEGKRRRDTRVMLLGLYLNGDSSGNVLKEMQEIGTIGVDAGLAGFFENKPDYTDNEWYEFCEKLRDKDWIQTEEGFCSSSGYGDGFYPVYARKNEEGLVTALEIRFL